MRYFSCIIFLATLASCAQNKEAKGYGQIAADVAPVEVGKTADGFKKAYFASGCFWCSESIYESVFGVHEVISGYSGGTGKNPTYRDYEKKGHTETVEVIYNPELVDYNTLLQVYFASQNVTQQNGQGPDLGSGYRSVIFYQNADEKRMIEDKIAVVQKRYTDSVAAEAIPFQKFWKAEEYHQNFDEKNPNHPYVRKVSMPRLYQFQNRHPELLKSNKE